MAAITSTFQKMFSCFRVSSTFLDGFFPFDSFGMRKNIGKTWAFRENVPPLKKTCFLD